MNAEINIYCTKKLICFHDVLLLIFLNWKRVLRHLMFYLNICVSGPPCFGGHRCFVESFSGEIDREETN